MSPDRVGLLAERLQDDVLNYLVDVCAVGEPQANVMWDDSYVSAGYESQIVHDGALTDYYWQMGE